MSPSKEDAMSNNDARRFSLEDDKRERLRHYAVQNFLLQFQDMAPFEGLVFDIDVDGLSVTIHADFSDILVTDEIMDELE